MMPAEKWFQYQEVYKKYGIDMKPVEKSKTADIKKNNIPMTNGDKKVLISGVFLCGIVAICMIIATTYAVCIKYEINQAMKETALVSEKVEILKVKVKEQNNINEIERRAIEELNMVYPNIDQLFFITEMGHKENEKRDFAQYIKENAYETW